MSDGKRGYPRRYVLLKVLILPDDMAYLQEVKAARSLRSLNATARLVIGEARQSRRLLNGNGKGKAA